MANWKSFRGELVKGNIGNAFGSLLSKTGGDSSAVLEPSAYRNGFYFFGDGKTVKFFEYDGESSALKAFVQCPPLQSIISRKAKAAANAKVWIMTNSGKGKDRESNSLFADKVRAKLNNPNPYQNGLQFQQQLKIFVDLFGWCVVYPTYATKSLAKYGFAEASGLWLLPPYMLDWRETGKLFAQNDVKGLFQYIRLNISGLQMDLPLDDILIVKDELPRMSDGLMDATFTEAMVLPDTKVRAMVQPINNIIGALEARGELISHRGANHLISPDSGGGQYVPMPVTPTDEQEMQDKFKKMYGIRANQWRNVIASQPMKAVKLSTPTKDLMLFEEVEANVMMLCDQWGYDFKLLSNIKSVALNGTEASERKRQLYQDTIIPETCSIYEQLAKGFKLQDNNCRFDVDFSHVPVMQKDQMTMARSREIMGKAVYADFKNGFITYNRALALLGEDTVPDGDVYYNEWMQRNGGMAIDETGNIINQPVA